MTSIDIAIRAVGVRAPVAAARLRLLARRCCAVAHERGKLSISVAFLAPAAIRRWNRQYRHRDTATDILTFSFGGQRVDGVTGEILLCPSIIRQRCRQTQRSMRHETERLFVHGVLHLFGVHHASIRQQRRLTRLEHRILPELDIPHRG